MASRSSSYIDYCGTTVNLLLFLFMLLHMLVLLLILKVVWGICGIVLLSGISNSILLLLLFRNINYLRLRLYNILLLLLLRVLRLNSIYRNSYSCLLRLSIRVYHLGLLHWWNSIGICLVVLSINGLLIYRGNLSCKYILYSYYLNHCWSFLHLLLLVVLFGYLLILHFVYIYLLFNINFTLLNFFCEVYYYK